MIAIDNLKMKAFDRLIAELNERLRARMFEPVTVQCEALQEIPEDSFRPPLTHLFRTDIKWSKKDKYLALQIADVCKESVNSSITLSELLMLFITNEIRIDTTFLWSLFIVINEDSLVGDTDVMKLTIKGIRAKRRMRLS